MKRTLSLILLVIFLVSSKPQSVHGMNGNKILGWAMIIGGVALSYDGFRSVDRSNPNLSVSATKVVNTYTYDYDIFYTINLSNSGNVDASNISVAITQWDNSYPYWNIYSTTINAGSLSKGSSATLYDNAYYVGDTAYGVGNTDVNTTYEYTKKMESNNIWEGVGGIAVALWGGYLLTKSNSNFGKALDKNNIEVAMTGYDKRLAMSATKYF